MKCSKCGKEYPNYTETKACYNLHTEEQIEVVAETPTLDALKNLLTKRSEPIKHITPKNVLEGEDAPHTLAQRLIDTAKDNSSNNTGKITLFEARYTLADKSLLLKDLIALINQYAPAVEIEQRPGNILHLHFGTPAKRSIKPAIPQLKTVDK